MISLKKMGILSQDLDKTARRFVQVAFYGIMASQSVMLTEIGRQLESRVSMKSETEYAGRRIAGMLLTLLIHAGQLSLPCDFLQSGYIGLVLFQLELPVLKQSKSRSSLNRCI